MCVCFAVVLMERCNNIVLDSIKKRAQTNRAKELPFVSFCAIRQKVSCFIILHRVYGKLHLYCAWHHPEKRMYSILTMASCRYGVAGDDGHDDEPGRDCPRRRGALLRRDTEAPAEDWSPRRPTAFGSCKCYLSFHELIPQ